MRCGAIRLIAAEIDGPHPLDPGKHSIIANLGWKLHTDSVNLSVHDGGGP